MDFRERASFQVIVGEEIDTSDGELIGLFLEAAVPVGLTAIETAEHIHAQGGLVYLQHPFYRLTGGRLQPAAREQLRARGLLDIVEARNGGPLGRLRQRPRRCSGRGPATCPTPPRRTRTSRRRSGRACRWWPRAASTPRRCRGCCARRP